MWVKVPSAAASVVCSACLAAAIALPAADMAADGSGQMAKALQPKAAQLAAASAAFDPFGALLNATGQTATDPFNNAINNLGQIAAFSALPFYRNILFNLPVGSVGPPITTASTGQTATDPFNNAINNLGQIAAFSALPFYRNILFNLPVGSVGPPITTASTAQGSSTTSTTTPGTGWTGVPRWSPTDGKTWDNGGAVTFSPPQNNDPSGSENGTPDPVVAVTNSGGQGGTSQPEAKPLPVSKKDANKSTADAQSTGNSGNGSFSRKFEPNPIIFENGSRGGAENGMFSGLNGPGGLFGGGKDQASSTGTAAPTSPTK
jgi:hypothetical protein